MQKGPSDQLYVAVKDQKDASHVIYQVTYTEEKELKYLEVYRPQGHKIVAF